MDKIKIYESFEISASDAISDIPKDKTLLNPGVTDELINNGTITNYTDPYNKDKIPFILKLNQLVLLSQKKVNIKFLELQIKILNLLFNQHIQLVIWKMYQS